MHSAWLQCLPACRTLFCCFQAGQETRLAEDVPAASQAALSTLSATHADAHTCSLTHSLTHTQTSINTHAETTHLAAVAVLTVQQNFVAVGSYPQLPHAGSFISSRHIPHLGLESTSLGSLPCRVLCTLATICCPTFL